MANLEPAALTSAPPTSAPPTRLRVLVVEDNALVLRLNVAALEREGHTVHAATGGEEALALAHAAAEPFDLLVTDIVLGRMNGYELATRIAASNPGVCIVVTSGYAAPATLPPIHGAGSVGFLQKPYTLDALAQLSRHLVAPGVAA